MELDNKSASAEKLESGDFFVTGVWWDGMPWSEHISTTDLAWAKRVDEASPFLRRTWLTVEVCPGIFTCNCREAS